MRTPVERAQAIAIHYEDYTPTIDNLAKDIEKAISEYVEQAVSTERQHQAKLEAELEVANSALRAKGVVCPMCVEAMQQGYFNSAQKAIEQLSQAEARVKEVEEGFYGRMAAKATNKVKDLEQQLAQLQDDAKRNESLVEQLQELDKDWHELRDERDKLQEENTKLKSVNDDMDRRSCWMAENERLKEENERLRSAVVELMNLLDGQTEPLHPVSWQTTLSTLKKLMGREG